MTKTARKPRARANGKPMAAPKVSEVASLPAPQSHPVADRLRALAAEIESGGCDSWVVCAVRPDGRFSAESNFGTHHLTALGFMQALCSKMAVWSAASLFGTASLTPQAQGQIQRN